MESEVHFEKPSDEEISDKDLLVKAMNDTDPIGSNENIPETLTVTNIVSEGEIDDTASAHRLIQTEYSQVHTEITCQTSCEDSTESSGKHVPHVEALEAIAVVGNATRDEHHTPVEKNEEAEMKSTVECNTTIHSVLVMGEEEAVNTTESETFTSETENVEDSHCKESTNNENIVTECSRSDHLTSEFGEKYLKSDTTTNTHHSDSEVSQNQQALDNNDKLDTTVGDQFQQDDSFESTDDLLQGGIKLIDVRSLSDSSENHSREMSLEPDQVTERISIGNEANVERQTAVESRQQDEDLQQKVWDLSDGIKITRNDEDIQHTDMKKVVESVEIQENTDLLMEPRLETEFFKSDKERLPAPMKGLNDVIDDDSDDDSDGRLLIDTDVSTAESSPTKKLEHSEGRGMEIGEDINTGKSMDSMSSENSGQDLLLHQTTNIEVHSVQQMDTEEDLAVSTVNSSVSKADEIVKLSGEEGVTRCNFETLPFPPQNMDNTSSLSQEVIGISSSQQEINISTPEDVVTASNTQVKDNSTEEIDASTSQEVTPSPQENNSSSKQNMVTLSSSQGITTLSSQVIVPSCKAQERDTGCGTVTTLLPEGVVIKEEPVDDSYTGSQQGDILDILSHTDLLSKRNESSTTDSEKNRKRKRKGNAEKLIHADIPSEEKRIKQEPVDDYGQFNPFSTKNGDNQPYPVAIQSNTNNISGNVLSAPTLNTASTNRTDSLSQLSKQVEQIPTVYGQATQYQGIKIPDNVVRFQLNNGNRSNTGQWMQITPPGPLPIVRQAPPRNVQIARYALQQVHTPTGPNIAYTMPAPCIISTNRMNVTPVTYMSPDQTKPMQVPISKEAAVQPPRQENVSVIAQILSPTTTSGNANTLNTGTTVISDSNIASVKNVKLCPVYATVPNSSSRTTTNSLPAGPNIQNTIKKPEEPLTSKTINIDTVGLSTITELIARKNPMSNYKPEPMPPGLLLPNEQFKTCVCYECGDVFNLGSSLKQHHGRYSLKIYYKCDNCRSVKTFFNKCQFLSHLRGHLNIEKTQAVPIHIKSDSIIIQPLTQEYQRNLFAVQTVSLKTRKENIQQRCVECGKSFLKADFIRHFSGTVADSAAVEIEGWYHCIICKQNMSTVCSLRAHKRIHTLEAPYTCPECGTNFSSLSTGESDGSPLERFSHHVLHNCLHTSRKTLYPCIKCPQSYHFNANDVKKHFLEKMEQYYKCNQCPMAFKLLDTFMKHFSEVHSQVVKKTNRYYKVIFRCHCCDSLIDDRSVLESHIYQHVAIVKRKTKFVFKCFMCPLVFPSKTKLSDHLNDSHKDNATMECQQCKETFTDNAQHIKHLVNCHNPNNSEEKNSCFCGTCGFYNHIDKSHRCLSQKTGKLNIVTPLTCTICSKHFYAFRALQSHVTSHQLCGINICSYCQRQDFQNIQQREIHEVTCRTKTMKTKNQNLVCLSGLDSKKADDIKPKIIPSKSQQQLVKLAPLVEYPCDKCEKVCPTQESWKEHLRKEHAVAELFPCHLCGLMYESLQSMKKHTKTSHEGKRNVYPCLMCRKKGIKRLFSFRSMLEKHLYTKHKINKSKIGMNIVAEDPEEEDVILPPPPTASVNSLSSQNLSSETEESPIKRLHVAGDQVFNCAKCAFSCKDRKLFSEHLSEHKITNTVQCPECGLSFAIVLSLKKHMFMVHKVKDFNKYCEDEGLEFKEEEITHLIPEEALSSHSDEESLEEDTTRDPLECKVCHRSFESETKLRSHLRIHGMAFIKNRRRERANSLKMSPNKSMNGNESSDSSSLSMT